VRQGENEAYTINFKVVFNNSSQATRKTMEIYFRNSNPALSTSERLIFWRQDNRNMHKATKKRRISIAVVSYFSVLLAVPMAEAQ
jgi:hypothetical protein